MPAEKVALQLDAILRAYVNVAVDVVLEMVLFVFLVDLPVRRRLKALHLRLLRDLYIQAAQTGIGDRDVIFRQMTKEAKSKERFTSCYALSLLGSLVRRSDETARVQITIEVLGSALMRDDPFVRHSAAETLLLLGPLARPAIRELQLASERFRNESAGVLAARALSTMQ